MVYVRDRRYIFNAKGADQPAVTDFFIDNTSDIDTIDTSSIGDCSTALVTSTGQLAIFTGGSWTWI